MMWRVMPWALLALCVGCSGSQQVRPSQTADMQLHEHFVKEDSAAFFENPDAPPLAPPGNAKH